MATQENIDSQEPRPLTSSTANITDSVPVSSIEEVLRNVTSSNPVSLNLSNDGLNVSLSVLDGDLVKQAISTLVATINEQNKKVCVIDKISMLVLSI